MTFQDAAMLILSGIYVQRTRKGQRVIVKSQAHAYAKMSVEDWMADDWEIYDRRVVEKVSRTWLP